MKVGEIKAIRAAYFQCLGFSSEAEAEEQVVRKLNEAVGRLCGDTLPISLSSVAENFMICPVTNFDDSVPDGQIEFDSAQGRFVITLNRRARRSSTVPSETETLGLFATDWDIPDFRLTYRGRFTYAHEVAHRFFFVQAEHGWRRAIELVTSEIEPAIRRRALRVLSTLEESLCNRIARGILIPNSQLVRVLGGTLVGKRETGAVAFYRVLEDLSSLFAVSRECVLVRLKDAVQHRQIDHPENFCAMLLAFSDKDAARRSRWEIRVKVAIMPKVLWGRRFRSIFPGMAVEKLGREAREFAEITLSGREEAYGGALNLPLTLPGTRTGNGKDTIRTQLRGWWIALDKQQSARKPDASILKTVEGPEFRAAARQGTRRYDSTILVWGVWILWQAPSLKPIHQVIESGNKNPEKTQV